MSVEEDSDGKRRWKAPADSRPPAGGRTMAKKEKVRKKTLGKSSREWVDRQLHDPEGRQQAQIVGRRLKRMGQRERRQDRNYRADQDGRQHIDVPRRLNPRLAMRDEL